MRVRRLRRRVRAIDVRRDEVRRSRTDAAVDVPRVTARLAEREEHPAGDVRVARAFGFRAPGEAAVGPLPAHDRRDIGGDARVVARRLLHARDADRADDAARDGHRVLFVRAARPAGIEPAQLARERAHQRGAYGDAQRTVRGVRELR